VAHRAPLRPKHRYVLSWLIPSLSRMIPRPRPGDESKPQLHRASAPEVPRPRKVEAVDPEARKKKQVADNWFAWNLEVGAIALPGFIASIVKFYFIHKLQWVPVSVLISHGVFTIPVMILATDSFRRWLKLPEGGRIRTLIRILSLSFSGLPALICPLAATLAAATNITPQNGESLTSITLWCLATVLPASFVGVIVSNKEVTSDES
jgi:hypothetical protein